MNAISQVLTVLKTAYSNVYSCHGILSMGILLNGTQWNYPKTQQNKSPVIWMKNYETDHQSDNLT